MTCRKLRVSWQLYDQLFRASASVALNLAEGSGKNTAAEQRRFYNISLGSLRECEAILALERVQNPELQATLNQLGAILFTLSRKPTN